MDITVYPFGTGGSLPASIGIVNDLDTGGADKALSAQQGVVLKGLTTFVGDYAVLGGETGKQSYGTVGNTITIGTLSGFEYIKIQGTPTSVKFKTHPSSIISSYIQYVDADDKIISLDGTSLSANTTYEKTITYPTGAVAVYINGVQGTIVISGTEDETVKDRVKRTTVVPLTSKTSYTLAQADSQFRDSTYNNKLLNAQNATGASVVTVAATGDYVLKIPLSGVESVTYPLFRTTGGYGTVAIDSNGIVVWEKANTTESDDTPFRVLTSELNGATHLLVSYLSTMVEGIEISNYTGEEVDINDYVLSVMPDNDYMGDSDTKVLNLKGASNMYQALLNKITEIAGGGSLDAFNDFGTMPSCIYGDPGAFLGDGTIDSDTAIIKYSDVIAKYDALMAQYPNYITKTSVGYDASGTIEMFYYTFTPKYWKQSVYLQAGVHGWEPDPVFALAEIMYLIANAYGTESLTDPYVPNNGPLKHLRGNIKFTIFPVVNPWGFNNRGDCGLDKRNVAQNNYDGVQLNASWGGNEPEAVMVRTLVASLSSELSFAIDMHSTVWPDSRTRYGCFYGGVNQGADNVRTIYRTYEWLYQFYNVKYPSIVQGDQCPNPLGGGFASVGYMTNTFNSYFYANYNIQASTMEFSDHTWTPELHTSVALSVAVNMYLNQIIQQLNDEYNHNSETGIPAGDNYPAKG